MKKVNPHNWLWIGLIMSVLTLIGCSDSNTTPYEGQTFPFGLQSAVSTSYGGGGIMAFDLDGDGFWDRRETRTFEYDSSNRLTSLTVVEEYDENADGVVDERYNYMEELDPNIVPQDERSEPKMIAASGPGFFPSIFPEYATIAESFEVYVRPEGGIDPAAVAPAELQLVYSESDTYDYNANGYLISALEVDTKYNSDGSLYQTWTRTRTYEYDADGNQTSETYDYVRTDSDGIPEYTQTETTTRTFDAAGDRLTYNRDYSYDNSPGDGTPDYTSNSNNGRVYDANGYLTSRYSEYSYQYENGSGYLSSDVTDYVNDDSGNPTSRTYTYTYDSDGEGPNDPSVEVTVYTYVNTYDDDGNLIMVVETSDKDSDVYVSEYTYNAAGELTGEKYSSDKTGDGNYDYVSTYTYTYNSSGQFVGEVYIYESFDSEGTLNYSETYTDTYEYDSAGRLTLETELYEYDDGGAIVPESYNESYTYTYTYEYDAAGLLTLDSEVYESDTGVEESEIYTYSYENGQLTEMTYRETDKYDSGIDTETETYTYENGNLAIYRYDEVDYESDGSTITYENRYGQTYTYENGVLVDILYWEDDNDDGDLDDSTTVEIFYEMGQLTGVSVTGEMYGFGPTLMEEPSVTSFVFNYDGNVVTIDTSYSDDDATEELVLDFGTNGIPSGSIDLPVMGAYVEYPRLPYDPRMDEDDYRMIGAVTIAKDYDEDDNDVFYYMTIPLPKLLAVLFAGDLDFGGGD